MRTEEEIKERMKELKIKNQVQFMQEEDYYTFMTLQWILEE